MVVAFQTGRAGPYDDGLIGESIEGERVGTRPFAVAGSTRVGSRRVEQPAGIVAGSPSVPLRQ